MKQFATISADIVASTTLSTEDYMRLIKMVRKTLEQLSEKYNHFWGRIIKGDSIECVMEKPNDSLRIALLLKALVKSFVPSDNKVDADFKKYGLRLVVGIGDMRIINQELDIMDGEAIYLSGRALASMKGKAIDGFQIVMSPNLDNESTFSAIAPLLSRMIDQATNRQCETLYYRLQCDRDIDVAEKMKISRAGANSNLRSAGWEWIENTLNVFENYDFEALRLNLKDFNETQDSLPDIYKNASVTYLKQGNIEKFKIYLDAFLDYYTKKHDLDNLDVARCFLDVADVYILQHDYQKALDYRLKALQIRKKTLGENNSLLVDDYMKMSDLYILFNDHNQAGKYAVMAQVILEQGIASIANDADKQEATIKEKRVIFDMENGIEDVKNINVYKRVLKSYLTATAEFYRIISKFYFKHSNYDEALSYGRKEISIQEEIQEEFLCENDSAKADSYIWLGNIYERIGNSLRASKCIDNAYNICKKEFGDKSKTTILMLGIKERITQEIDKRRMKMNKKNEKHRSPEEFYHNHNESYLPASASGA